MGIQISTFGNPGKVQLHTVEINYNQNNPYYSLAEDSLFLCDTFLGSPAIYLPSLASVPNGTMLFVIAFGPNMVSLAPAQSTMDNLNGDAQPVNVPGGKHTTAIITKFDDQNWNISWAQA